MYFPSLTIITTLACAALSVAAPLPEAPTIASEVEGAVASIKEKFENVVRDVNPAAPVPPSPPKPSLLDIFDNLLSKLEPVLEEISQSG